MNNRLKFSARKLCVLLACNDRQLCAGDKCARAGTRAAILFVLFLQCLGQSGLQAQWTAINDHAGGPGTIATATRYHFQGLEDGTQGPLRNLANGTPLPVSIRLTVASSPIISTTAVDPEPSSPAHGVFAGFVDFTPPVNENYLLNGVNQATIELTGLNPEKTYAIRLTAMANSSREQWTLLELNGAESFENNHTANTLTPAIEPSLSTNQVAVKFADNHLSHRGDMAFWDSVAPGADGTVEIVSRLYQGPLPGGAVPFFATFIPTAISVQEIEIGPPSIVQHPGNQIVSEGELASFTVLAQGYPLRYQWYFDGQPIPGATEATYAIPSVTITDRGQYSVTVSNFLGLVESQPAGLAIQPLPMLVFPFNQVWAYSDEGIDYGTAWREPDFDDTGWSRDLAPLGVETTVISPPIASTNFMRTDGIRTYYFRTSFVFDQNPRGFEIQMTNLIDDGAVFYLNGHEVLRIRMPDGFIDFNTYANSTVGDASQEAFPISSEHLVRGTNVVAVEVHQVSFASGDIVMGSSWLATPLLAGTPLIIVAQPQDQTVVAGMEARFEVIVSGTALDFQWYFNGDPIPGADQAALILPGVTHEQEGIYQLLITDIFGEKWTQEATLTVLIDDIPPFVLNADAGTNATLVHITFSEAVNTNLAAQVANYSITNTWGEPLAIHEVTALDATHATLATEPLLWGTNYLLRLENITDLAAATNVVDPNRLHAIRRSMPLVTRDSFWTYYDPFPPFDDLDPGADWRELDFETPTWGYDQQPFGYDITGATYPWPLRTPLSGGSIASFFRYLFVLPADSAQVQLRFRYLVDDGAVIYLNGEEFHRFNLPPGPATFETMTDVPVNRAQIRSLTPPEDWFLTAGTNVVAVSLHAYQANDLDAVFALEMDASFPSFATGPVFILHPPQDLNVMEGEAALFEHESVAAHSFQWYRNGEPVEGATEPAWNIQHVPLDWDGSTVHLVASNDTYQAVSAAATLHVFPDSTLPQLILAELTEDLSRLRLTFSEPMLAEDLTNAVYYILDDGTGAPPLITAFHLVNDSTVELETTSSNPLDLRVEIQNLRDQAQSPNALAAPVRVRPAYHGAIVPSDAEWAFLQPSSDPDPNWNEVSFDDSAWPRGFGVFGFPMGEQLAPGFTMQTALAVTDQSRDPIITSYFRHRLPASGSFSGELTISNVIDDGAVFYLNGLERNRLGMPTFANINYATLASRTSDVGNHGVEVFQWDASVLATGTNIFAVEVHQGSTTSGDIVFGTSVHYQRPMEFFPTVSDTRLVISRENDQLTLTWSNAAYRLEEATELRGAQTVWTEIATEGLEYRVDPAPPQRFYRLRQAF